VWIPVRKCHLQNLVLDGRIILKRIPKREDGALTGLLWHRTGKGGGAVVNAAMKVRIA
jgi:hypothetical protein